MSVVKAVVVPGIPHPLLCPEKNAGWRRLQQAFEAARAEIMAAKPDVLLIYSTMWPSVLGHQIQARAEPEWVHVDELFHELGSIPYRFRMHTDFAHTFRDCAEARGLHASTVDYHGFPIDTGSVAALKLLNPNNAVPACIVSSNVYADRAETQVLGKAARDAVEQSGLRAVAVVVTTLSNRLFTDWIDPAADHIHSQKDDEWNRKILEFLGNGRLEDVSQLSRSIHSQVRVKKVVRFKPMWWLSAFMGQHNRYTGNVHAYEALYGTGAAVVTLTPSEGSVGDKEFDEDDVEVWRGDRTVLGAPENPGAPKAPSPPSLPTAQPSAVATSKAPAPVGAYPHARRVGELLFISGMGPRQPGTNAIPGGPIQDEDGGPLDYDVAAQTHAVFDNITAVLEASGASLADVVDVQVFLVDMKRDFAAFNAVYAERIGSIGPTRTTVAVSALPTPIAVELKVVARPS